jgi:hypothetical protein
LGYAKVDRDLEKISNCAGGGFALISAIYGFCCDAF